MVKKLKILHVNDVASVGSNLVQALHQLGFEAQLFNFAKAVNLTNKFQIPLLPLMRTQEAFRLQKLVQQQQFNIVHVHYALHAYLPLLAGIPYFLHIHGSDVRRNLQHVILRPFIWYAIQRAIKVFYVTPDLKSFVEKIRPDAIFLPDPVNFNDFDLRPQTTNRNLRVLCISKLDRFKGVERFLKIIELLWQSHPQTEVGIFNFGNSSIGQTFIEQNNNNPRLTLLSRTPHKQMANLIHSFDIILGQQSLKVGALGVSELEAMACGKPVVCYFNYPNAYPAPPPILISRTVEQGREHIVQLLNNPDLGKKLGDEGYNWALKYHERKMVAQQLLKHYQGSLQPATVKL